MNDTFEWQRDLFIATQLHNKNLDWLDKVKNEQSAYIDYWKIMCANAIASGEKLSLAGLNTIYLVHGAVAVGSLNTLANKTTLPDTHLAAAAKFAMPSALIGIGLVGVGQIILAHFGTQMANRVSSRLIGTVTHRRSRAFPRYWRKMHRRIISKADYYIYGSVCWFFAYALISYIILVSG